MSSNENTPSEAGEGTPLVKLFKKCKSATFQIDGQTYTIGRVRCGSLLNACVRVRNYWAAKENQAKNCCFIAGDLCSARKTSAYEVWPESAKDRWSQLTFQLNLETSWSFQRFIRNFRKHIVQQFPEGWKPSHNGPTPTPFLSLVSLKLKSRTASWHASAISCLFSDTSANCQNFQFYLKRKCETCRG